LWEKRGEELNKEMIMPLEEGGWERNRREEK
jgi:hypothetical protein